MAKSTYLRTGLLLTLIGLAAIQAKADTPFINFGAGWNYLAIGSAAPTGAGAADWRNAGFNDASWTNGIAEFGYGDNTARTVVSFGPNAANKYSTTYFRKVINIPNIALFGTIRINTYIDDGAVIYVNGTEVARSNMPGGAPGYGTLATASATEDGKSIISFDVTTAAFVSGNNCIAVEVHQNAVTSTDLTFDLELIAKPAAATTTLLNFGASWRYLDNGSNQGTAWRATGFVPTGWGTGNAEFGYGDGGEATVVSFGGNAANKHITTYFRTTFNITDINAFGSILLNLVRDDGAVIYVNGTEVARSNMPNGTIAFNTPASGAIGGADESAVNAISVGTTAFVTGSNVIAVELHQSDAASTDISFNLQIQGVPAGVEPNVLRGPMLQMVSGDAITIKWRTSTASNSRILYGTSENSLTSTASNAAVVSDHEMRITGLTPDTKYYYAIGTSTSVLTGSYRNYFITAPPANTTRKIRIGVFGDPGTGNANQRGTRDGYMSLKGEANNSEIALFLGDNAYNGGFENEHQNNFFNIYDDNIFNNHTVFPVPGNHEYDNNGTLAVNHAIPYYDIFTVPTAAESGGRPSGTEHYYSFDYGNIHFIMLDSYGYDAGKLLYDSTGDQALWLKQDLAQNAGTHKWTVVSLHHPPYTNGTHFSNSEGDLTAIRQQITPILERFGVDIVLAGHSHVYERSFLVQGHRFGSGTFVASPPPTGMQVSNSSARYDGTVNSCPYFTIDSATAHGTVYVVAGSAGQIGGGTNAQYPVFYYRNYSGTSGGEVGVLYLEVEDNRMTGKFVGSSGTVRDQFVIMKDVKLHHNLNIVTNTPTTLSASWIGGYNWYTPTPGVLATTRDHQVTLPSVGTFTYYVSDSLAPTTTCMTDTFTITVNVSLPVTISRFEAFLKNNKGVVQWTTQVEENVDYFTVEHSVNGRDFTMLTMVRATGNSNSKNDYEFVDNYIQEGNNYYRLSSTDKDGKTTIIGIKQVTYRVNRSFTVSINPNPAINGAIKAVVQSNKKQILKVRLLDIKGAEVYKKNFSASEGNNNLYIPVKPGTYILNIESKDGLRTNEKILVK